MFSFLLHEVVPLIAHNLNHEQAVSKVALLSSFSGSLEYSRFLYLWVNDGVYLTAGSSSPLKPFFYEDRRNGEHRVYAKDCKKDHEHYRNTVLPYVRQHNYLVDHPIPVPISTLLDEAKLFWINEQNYHTHSLELSLLNNAVFIAFEELYPELLNYTD